jgi:DNA (cytosine-5)-methyltransferase 1
MTLTAIDIFSGIGGWNIACSSLGIRVIMAANHSQPSLKTNKLNFPKTKQVNIDIMTCDPEEIPDADILTASPECTFQSTSSGVELLNQLQLGLWTDREHDPFVERSRETMNGVHRWAKLKRKQNRPFKLIFVENVTEIKHWSGLKAWYTDMEALGYRHTTISFNSRFARPFPAPVPQSRDRCYIILWLRDLPAPDMHIHPPTYCQRCQRDVAAVQCWTGYQRRFGDYGIQYIYHCSLCNKEVIPHFTPASQVLDWTLPAPQIGTRKRPLCAETLRKIRRGLHWYSDLSVQKQQDRAFMLSYYGNACYRMVSDVAGTVTTHDRHALITLPDDWQPGDPVPDTLACGYRMFAWYEYKALMGIPENFVFDCSITERKRQLGLAVTPAAAVEVLSRGVAILEKVAVEVAS